MSDTTCIVIHKKNKPTSYRTQSSYPLTCGCYLFQASVVEILSEALTDFSTNKLKISLGSIDVLNHIVTHTSMISIMANKAPLSNICFCLFFMVTTTLALHHDWDVEISRCKKQEQERNMSFFPFLPREETL